MEIKGFQIGNMADLSKGNEKRLTQMTKSSG